MLNLEIKHFERNGYNSLYCFEDCIATIASYENIDYQMMFLSFDVLNFNIEKTKLTGKVIDGFVHINNEKYDLEKFHGLEYTTFNESDDILYTVKDQLSQNKTIIVQTDSYYNYWDVEYMRNHMVHLYLVVGLDNKYVYLCDPFYQRQKEKVEIEIFRNSCTNYILYKINKPKILKKDFLKEFCSYTLNDEKNNKYIRELSYLGNAYADIFKPEVEFTMDNAFNYIQSIYINIIKGRAKYFALINYLCQLYNQDFSKLKYMMEEIVETWVIIKNMLIKSIYCKDLNLQFTLKNKVISIIKNEQFIYSYIQNYFNKESIKIINKVDHSVNRHITPINGKSRKHYNYYYVNLKKYANNNAFGTINNPNCESDFFGVHEFIQYNNVNQCIDIDNIKFYTLITPDNTNDNIVCDNQEILINSNDVYNYISILATSEYGEAFDKIKVRYVNSNIDELYIKLSDISFSPLYGEKIAWSGVTYRTKRKNEYELHLENAHIFKLTYSIKTKAVIHSIQLPECPNIHIFGMTLSK